jgi:GR25 family glycosyltransferase involved in LPS biosynthesis
MVRIFSFFFALAFVSLIADIEDYFKIPAAKSDYSKMKNIDFIYMINLDQRPEKYAHSVAELAPYEITPYRFSAVNGWELSLEALNELGIKYEPWMRQGLMGTCYLPEDYGEPHHEIMHVIGRNYFCHCMSRGAIGIVLSHLSILKDAYDSGYETIWVMEDDIEVIKNPHVLSELIDHLDRLIGKDGWDFLFTDYDTKSSKGDYVPCFGAALRPNFSPANSHRFYDRYNISLEFRRVFARYGAYSMIVRRSGMKKMLDFLKDGIFLPYDMEYTLPDDIRMYTVRDDVVSTQPKAFSDNGAPNYKQNL